MKFLVLHGPNLNLLGRREPAVYGSATLPDVDRRIRELTSQILAKHTGQSLDQIELDVERDRYLSAIQAKEYGLIDEVIAHRE